MRGGRLMIANLSNRRLTETAYNCYNVSELFARNSIRQAETPVGRTGWKPVLRLLPANLAAVVLSLPSAAVN
jgi:hypothetical protein